MDNDYEKQYLLQQHKTICECYRDSNNAAIAFSKSALNSALLLNGMGAVAVLYSPHIKLTNMTGLLFCFAIGALFATMAAGCTYLAQYNILKTWDFALYHKPLYAFDNLGHFLPKIKCITLFRLCAIILVFISYVLFLAGAIIGYHKLI